MNAVITIELSGRKTFNVDFSTMQVIIHNGLQYDIRRNSEKSWEYYSIGSGRWVILREVTKQLEEAYLQYQTERILLDESTG